MPFQHWSPQALSYLAQFILAAAIALYLLLRVLTEKRQRGAVAPTMHLLMATMAAFTPVVLLSFLKESLSFEWRAYVVPWVSPCAIIAAGFFIRLAYNFPQPLPIGRVERSLVSGLFALAVIVEWGVAVWRFSDTVTLGHIWFRPAYMDYLPISAMAWSAILFLRQMLTASGRTGKPDTGDAGDKDGGTGSGRFLRALRQLWLSFTAKGNRDLSAARAYFAFTLIPLALVIVLALRAMGYISIFVTEIMFSWATLLQLSCFALAYLNYMPERSSFMVKLSGVTTTIALAIIICIGWLVAPAYVDTYVPNPPVAEGQTLRFTPDSQGGYILSREPYFFDSDIGVPSKPGDPQVELPFDFPFYGKSYKRIYPRLDGIVGLETAPVWPDTAHRYGPQPAIFPLAVELGGFDDTITPQYVFIRKAAEKVVLTWNDVSETAAPENHYRFQLALYPDGRMDMSYADLPDRLGYDLYVRNKTLWLIGITPGHQTGTNRLIDLNSRLPVTGKPQEGLIVDAYLDFQAYLDRHYAPMAGFLVSAVLVLLLTLPVFFRVNLVRPLTRLLSGVQAFREGRYDANVPVAFQDEIGYLTTSFNEMAGAQRELISTLEERVAQRTKEVLAVSANNARLEERVRLSGDLHDTVSQTLFSAAMLADTLAKQESGGGHSVELERLSRLNRHALTEMRHLLVELRDSGMANQPLGQRLEAHVREFSAAHSISVELETTGDVQLPLEVQAMLFRIVQESLNNVVKHASATSVYISFEALSGQALLVIRDDGRGFDPDGIGPQSLGLQIMRERAQYIGAVLEIDSTPDKGTTITIVWFSNRE